MIIHIRRWWQRKKAAWQSKDKTIEYLRNMIEDLKARKHAQKELIGQLKKENRRLRKELQVSLPNWYCSECRRRIESALGADKDSPTRAGPKRSNDGSLERHRRFQQ